MTLSSQYLDDLLNCHAMRSVCSVDGCDRFVQAEGLCRKHVQRMRKFGSIDLPPRRRCSVSWCERSHGSHGYCAPHAHAVKAGKDPENHAIRDRAKASEIPETCTLSECEEPHEAKGFCVNHYLRWRKHGDPRRTDSPPGFKGATGTRHPAWRGDDVGYAGVHSRIYRTLGAAKGYKCVDCGGQAEQWSYDYQDPGQKDVSGILHFGLDPQYYDPRCRSCHRCYDIRMKEALGLVQ